MADYNRCTAKVFARSFKSRHNIFERSRPTAAWLTYTPILEIGRGYALHRQRRAESVGVAEIVLRSPKSAVDENDEASCRRFRLP
jgi:hypothetical protein